MILIGPEESIHLKPELTEGSILVQTIIDMGQWPSINTVDAFRHQSIWAKTYFEIRKISMFYIFLLCEQKYHLNFKKTKINDI